MDIGPVLHPDHVMAGKMDALYNRAAARDFLDIDAAISSGRYTLEHLCKLAHDADAGFDRQLFAAVLGRIGDKDFTEYAISTLPRSVNGSRTGTRALPRYAGPLCRRRCWPRSSTPPRGHPPAPPTRTRDVPDVVHRLRRGSSEE